MPVSRGGGHSGGGGNGSFHSGGSHGGSSGGYKGPRYSNTRPFPGSRRFFYINSLGCRRHFYYKGTPIKRNIWNTIIPSALFSIFALALCVCMVFAVIPHKLKEGKCLYSGEYISDANNLFSNDEETAIKKSMEAFYEKTGVEPYLYAFEAVALPVEYGNKITESVLEQYAYDLYLNTFYDEGHFMILYTESWASGNLDFWMWIDCTGTDALDIVDDDAFNDFQYSMQKYLRNDNYTNGMAIAKSFDDATETIMNPDYASLLFIIVFFLFFLIVPIVGVVRSIKEIKEVNAYCDYRDSHGGEDFIEPDDEFSDDWEDFFDDKDSKDIDDENYGDKFDDESDKKDKSDEVNNDSDGSDLFD